MSFSAITMATLMVSTSPTAVIDEQKAATTIVASNAASSGQSIIVLASGSAVPIQLEQPRQTDSINSPEYQTDDRLYSATHAQHAENGFKQAVALEAPILPVYLPAPTAPTTFLTISSNLTFFASDTLLDGSGQPVEPDQNDDNVIVVTGPDRSSPIDPLSQINAESFEIAQDIDRALVAPIANAYKQVLPTPIRSGLRNFLSNLGEPVVFLNYLLQLKPGKAVETLGRFAINSTIGIGGIIDVAKDEPFNLPNRLNGFANTLGYYGVKPGAYLYLPIAGSTTVRDLIGDGLDLLVLPTAVGKPFTEVAITAPLSVVRALDRRIQRDDEILEMQEESADPYVSARKQYLESRQMEIDILHGKIPDPLSRKNKPRSGDEAKNDTVFQYETAQLWYLKP